MPGPASGRFLAQNAGLPATNSVGLPVARPKKKLKAFHWDKVDTPLATHWAAHTPSPESREEKYHELSKKGILDEVEKLFMAKEIKKLGGGSAKKDDKKQIISNDLRKAFGKDWMKAAASVEPHTNSLQKSRLPSSHSTLLRRWCR